MTNITRRSFVGGTAAVLGCVWIQQANAGFFGPDNFDECILENMKGVTSDRAAALIARSCRKKFPRNSENKSREPMNLPEDAKAKLTGRAGLSYGNYFSVSLYNGNHDWRVTEVVIGIKDKAKGTFDYKNYVADVVIPPLKTIKFGVSIIRNETDEYSWYIAGAAGYRQ